MAAVLVNKPLFGDAPLAVEVAFVGLLVGAGFGWLLLEGPFVRTEPNRIVWSAVAFLGLHSVGDVLVLGRDFVGGVVPTVRLTGSRSARPWHTDSWRLPGPRPGDLGRLEGETHAGRPSRGLRIRSRRLHSGRGLHRLRRVTLPPPPNCDPPGAWPRLGGPWAFFTLPRVPSRVGRAARAPPGPA